MIEKRTEKRSPIELAASCGVGEDFQQEQEATVYNLSLGGFCFGTNKVLKIGEQIKLAVELGRFDEAVVDVRVVWVKKDEKTAKYITGVQIMDKRGRGFKRFMDFCNSQVSG